MGRCPDLVPTVAAAACFAKGTTVITNVAHLRLKESDRIDAVAENCTRAGAAVTTLADGLRIHPKPLPAGQSIAFASLAITGWPCPPPCSNWPASPCAWTTPAAVATVVSEFLGSVGGAGAPPQAPPGGMIPPGPPRRYKKGPYERDIDDTNATQRHPVESFGGRRGVRGREPLFAKRGSLPRFPFPLPLPLPPSKRLSSSGPEAAWGSSLQPGAGPSASRSDPWTGP